MKLDRLSSFLGSAAGWELFWAAAAGCFAGLLSIWVEGVRPVTLRLLAAGSSPFDFLAL